MQLAPSKTSIFYKDAIKGLQSHPKYLQSKYFYDEGGDILFQKIMHSEEYYLTNCEMEIVQTKASDIVKNFTTNNKPFDLIELGAGDCTKSVYLLKQLLQQNIDFTFYPIDISNHVIKTLETELPQRLNGLNIKGLNGEYLNMLAKAKASSTCKKVVLFMGSNIGNMTFDDAGMFCKKVYDNLNSGDLFMIGFDLKKDPDIILDAYNDKQGITRDFNLNLLKRINRELDADFDIEAFEHFPVYNPESGECRSYLISKCKQRVNIGDSEFIDFDEYETIFMEISRKYSISEINELAFKCGFKPLKHFYDSKKWFVDVLWEKKQ